MERLENHCAVHDLINSQYTYTVSESYENVFCANVKAQLLLLACSIMQYDQLYCVTVLGQ